jgi:hypothetical protein
MFYNPPTYDLERAVIFPLCFSLDNHGASGKPVGVPQTKLLFYAQDVFAILMQPILCTFNGSGLYLNRGRVVAHGVSSGAAATVE